MGAKDYNNPTKAKDADVLMLTASRFDEFPDIVGDRVQISKT